MQNLKLIPVLIPTEDATNIYLHISEDRLVCLPNTSKISGTAKSQHIYLCSTRELKEGEWGIDSDTNTVFKLGTYKTSRGLKIEFTSDPKLIADGVAALPENSFVAPTSNWDGQVSFLEEFVSRYNNRDFKIVGAGKTAQTGAINDYVRNLDIRNVKGVDVERLAKKDYSAGSLAPIGTRDRALFEQKKESFISGYNQALQSNAGGFSLEDIEKAIKFGMGVDVLNSYGTEKVVKYLQSLTPKQGEKVCKCGIWAMGSINGKYECAKCELPREYSKQGEIEMYVEMEEHLVDRNGDETDNEDAIKGSIFKIKLINGQPIIHFK